MSIQIFGLPVSRGVAIGRAVLVASGRVDVPHHFIDPNRVQEEVDRLLTARDTVNDEFEMLKRDLPSRDAVTALREYAPGSDVVIGTTVELGEKLDFMSNLLLCSAGVHRTDVAHAVLSKAYSSLSSASPQLSIVFASLELGIGKKHRLIERQHVFLI